MYESIKDAIYLKEIGETQKYLIKEGHPETEKLLDIIYAIREEGANTDTAYEIVSKAIDTLIDSGEETAREYSDSASVYTADRLGYLTIYNQDDITNIVREYNSDIATACAVWYDQQVERAINLLMEAYQAELDLPF